MCGKVACGCSKTATIAVWCPNHSYNAGDIVTYLGITYIAIANSTCVTGDISQAPVTRTDLWKKLV